MKFQHKLSFQRQLTTVLLLSSLLITLFTSMTAYQLAFRRFREMSIQSTQSSIGILHDTVSNYLDQVQLCTTEILTSPQLRAVSAADAGEFSDQLRYLETSIRSQVGLAYTRDVDFSAIHIYLQNGYTYSLNSRRLYADYEACMEDLSHLGLDTRNTYVGTQWDVLTPEGAQTPSLTCIRYLYDTRMNRMGVALFALAPYELDKLFGSLADAQIINREGKILFNRNGNLMGSCVTSPKLLKLISGATGRNTVTYEEHGLESMVSFAPLGNLSTYLVVPNTTYETLLEKNTKTYRQSVLSITLFSLVAAVLLSVLLSRRVSKCIQELLDFIKGAGEDHDTTLRYEGKGNSEYDKIGRSINGLLDNIQSTAALREEEMKINQTLELNLLRAQLNPHLLYNTLDSVLLNLEKHRDENAVNLIANLSQYFQYALSKGQQIIPLEDELKLIQHYINLQRLARHKAFTLCIQIPEELYGTPLPKLTLQPIVENAIIHGVDGYRDDGTITLTSQEEGPFLHLKVSDNGFGITPEELEQLNQMLDAQPSSAQLHSFGLYGINRTLRQTFGKEYRLHITSQMDVFTCVTVTIPRASQPLQTVPVSEYPGERKTPAADKF
ncbi:MAG: histidine kinase [Lachnospiraceae bacterium]|nr:histidine kinase [Lachnospiraceae bacterium]